MGPTLQPTPIAVLLHDVICPILSGYRFIKSAVQADSARAEKIPSKLLHGKSEIINMNDSRCSTNFLTNLSKYDPDRNNTTFSTYSSIPNPKTVNPCKKAPRNAIFLRLSLSPNIQYKDDVINPKRSIMPNTNPDCKMFQSTCMRSEHIVLNAVYPSFHPLVGIFAFLPLNVFMSQPDSLANYCQVSFLQGSLLLNNLPKKYHLTSR